MSKKRAVSYNLQYVWKNSPYLKMDFIDKKGKVMMSSVDVLLNEMYLLDDGGWKDDILDGYVRSR